jgi:hypothetical protein
LGSGGARARASEGRALPTRRAELVGRAPSRHRHCPAPKRGKCTLAKSAVLPPARAQVLETIKEGKTLYTAPASAKAATQEYKDDHEVVNPAPPADKKAPTLSPQDLSTVSQLLVGAGRR